LVAAANRSCKSISLSSHAIDSFLPRQQIDQRFFDTPYYVAPNEPVAQEAFAVIREAMRHKAMVALGRLVLAKRERVIALEPYGKGLLGTTLRYPYEVRDAKDYFAELPELALAQRRGLVLGGGTDRMNGSLARPVRPISRAKQAKVGASSPIAMMMEPSQGRRWNGRPCRGSWRISRPASSILCWFTRSTG
jgi:hypothetical protein